MANFNLIGWTQRILDKRKLRPSDLLLRGVLVFTLLFVQAVALNHTHSGDLADRVDCDICLKVGSSDDVLVSTNLLLAVKAPSTAYTSKTIDPLHSVSFRATARAPPLV